MSSFFKKHQEYVSEDVAHRGTDHKSDAYLGRRRLDNAAEIDLERIEADEQHRKHFDEEALRSLARSLKDHGQKQPIHVRWEESRGKYVIVAGERRFRAAQLAGISSIQCVVGDGNMSEAEILRDQVIENALREDLKPTEQAGAFRDLMQMENFNAKELAKYLHVAPSTVSRRLAVLDLPEDLQEKVDEGTLAIKDAIKLSKQNDATLPLSPKKGGKKRPTRERKICVGAFTVTVKARRILTDALVLEALEQASVQVQQQRDAA